MVVMHYVSRALVSSFADLNHIYGLTVRNRLELRDGRESVIFPRLCHANIVTGVLQQRIGRGEDVISNRNALPMPPNRTSAQS